MNSIQAQLVYVMVSGREYRTMGFIVDRGEELEDLHSKVKYQLTMDAYPIEFTNDRGDAQVVMARNVETIVVRVLADVPEPAPVVYEETLEEFASEPVAVGGATATKTKFDKTYSIPVPTQHVHVVDMEDTQEVPLPVGASREPASSAGSGAPESDAPEEPVRGPYAPRSRANSRRRGRGSRGR